MIREPKDPLVEIADLAEELCDPRQHTERIYGWTPSRHRKVIRVHKTIQAGLLEQLRDAIRSAAGADEQGRRVIPGSRPPLLLEALTRQLIIVTGVNEWMSHHRIENRTAVEANIRSLVGAAPNMPSDSRIELLRDLRRWRSWAAVMSGWANPPLQPHVACPNPDCSTISSLRIIPDRKSGYCTACEHIWDDRDGSINLLADYIKAETNRERIKVKILSSVQGHGGWAERRTA